MASLGRLNWLRADSVTGVSGRTCPLDVLIIIDTHFIPRGKQTNTKSSTVIGWWLMEFLQGSGDYCHAQHPRA